jgi:hypothetical protein
LAWPDRLPDQVTLLRQFLATDPTARRQFSEAILQACPRLYDSQEDVLVWTEALDGMVAGWR